MAESSKEIRDPTQLRNLVIRHMGNNRVLVQVWLGLNHAQFRSYLGVLDQSKVSILVLDWDHVTEVDKNLIWEDIFVSYLFKCY